MKFIISKIEVVILVAVLSILSIHTAYASAKDGEATVYEGQTTTIAIGAPFQRTLQQSTGITYQWYSGNTSCVTVTSSNKYQATIRGIKATSSCKVYYKCSYFIDGFYRTMDFYYDITVKASTVSVTNITLSQSSANLKEGNTLQLSASVYPTNATNRNVNWSTSNASVATVTNYGFVTAKSAGSATITCRAQDGSGEYATCNITVKKELSPTSVSLSKSKATLVEGETLRLIADIIPIDATNKSLTWISDNPSVATVDTDGLITAIAEGGANIIVTTANNLAAVCSVKVIKQVQVLETDWAGNYTVNSKHVVTTPTREYNDNFEMTIEYNGADYVITSMFGEDLTTYNNGGLVLKDNGDETATIDVSYYNVLRYTDNDSPLYALYVFNEVTDDWDDDWTLTMNSDGTITVQDFYVVAFTWMEGDGKWKNGQLEAMYYDMQAEKKQSTIGVSDVAVDEISYRIAEQSIILSEETDVSVYNISGALVFSGKTQQVTNLSQGIYIVKIGVQSKKVLIN
ncbi:Ig-like domain-containing protein [Bacteroides sp.]